MNKFILNSLLFLLLLGIVPSASQDFTPVIRNDGFGTSTDLRSSYTQGGQNGAHIADVFFKTKIPSFNLDQDGVTGVDCNDNKITISLNDDSSIEQIKNWPDKVLLFVSHRWECFGEQTTQYYTIGDRTIDSSSKKITFTSEKAKINDMSEEFTINISWDNGDKKKRRIRRRSHRLHKRQEPINISNKIDLNVLFDETTGKSSKPNFSLISLEQNNTSESLVCVNCFTRGQATVSLRIAGKLSPKFELTDATVTLDGNIKFNLDMAITGKVGATLSSPNLQVLSIPLNPLSVPAIFDIGPSLDLGASAKISADITGTFRTGAEYDYPNFSAKAIFVDDPKFEQSGFEPQIKPHDSSVGITVSASISGTLKPQLAFGLQAFGGLFKLKVGFGLVTTLGNKISIGSDSGCKEITQPHLESKLDGNLGFFVDNKDFSVLDFPTKTLLDKCI